MNTSALETGKKEQTVTRSMAWLHTWAGLLAGWVLFLIFLTGTFTVFFPEISLWMQPERVASRPMTQTEAAQVAERFVMDRGLHDARLLIRLPMERRPDLRIGALRKGEAVRTYYIDTATGQDVPVRETQGGYLFQALHWRLNIDRDSTELGIWIVGLATAIMLAVLVSGIVIHKRIFKDIFVFRPRSSYQRSWLDAHNVSSVLSLPFLFLIAYTGLVFLYYIYMPAGISALYGGDRDAFRRDSVFINSAAGSGIPQSRMKSFESFTRIAIAEFGEGKVDSIRLFPKDGRTEVEVWRVRNDRIGQQMDRLVFDAESGRLLHTVIERLPAQRVQSVLAGLHLAEFGGHAMRWLYFAMGLFGTASIATGLVLFIIKRQRKTATVSATGQRWHAAAARTNVAAVAGLCIACGAYLWSNRLLPADLAGRSLLEVQCFFFVWGLSVVHALTRPHLSAWIEQLSVAALIAILLPAVNLTFTGQWFGSYVLNDDWTRAAVELTTVAMGFALGTVAWLLRSRERSAADHLALKGGASS